MGGSGKWFKSLISHRNLKPSTIDQEKDGDNGKKKWKLWRSSSSECSGFGSSMKKGHFDEDEAFTAAVAAVIRAPHKDFLVIKKEWAAIRIQAIFRGFLARRALRALRAVVRLQAIFRGRLVRKQAAVTLRCMQALVRVQASVRARNVRKFPEGKTEQKQLNQNSSQADPVMQAEQGWCNIPGTMKEVKSKLQIRQEGAIKRDRALAYSLSNQQAIVCDGPNFRAPKPGSPLRQHHSLDRKSLFERWTASKPWESKLMDEIYLESPHMTPLSRKSDDLVPRFNSYQQNGLSKPRRNGDTTRISAKSVATKHSTPSSSSSDISSECCMYDDSPESTSCISGSPSLPSTNTFLVEAKEKRKICKPTYMSLTESTKAKVKTCRCSSQNSKRLLMDDRLSRSHSTETDFLNGEDTRSSCDSNPSVNSWKDHYSTL